MTTSTHPASPSQARPLPRRAGAALHRGPLRPAVGGRSGGPLHARGHNAQEGLGDVVGGTFCLAVWLIFLLMVPECRHWFALPVLACGVLISGDAADWFLGRRDSFDVYSVTALFGVHFFFLAPLLHVACDYWMPEVIAPRDWRPWLGGMACLNAVGIVLYRAVRPVAYRSVAVRRRVKWQIDEDRFFLVGGAIMILCTAAQLYVYADYGGLSGYIDAYSSRTIDEDAFDGYGGLFLISESAPALLLLMVVLACRGTKAARSWRLIVMLLVAFVVLRLMFGGLRGSRSHLVWGLLWATATVHWTLRPIPRRWMLAGMAFVFAFLYLYGFYKSAGGDVLRMWQDRTSLIALEEQTGRDIEFVLLTDLGRSDVQAFLLHQHCQSHPPELAWGSTYVGTAALVCPRRIWPDRPPLKTKAGTNNLYGPGSWEAGFRSSRIYGLAGEAMMNFGVAAVPLALAGWGLLVGWVKGWQDAFLRQGDARLLLAAVGTVAAILALGSDSDNVFMAALRLAAIPTMLLILCAKVVRVDPAAASATRSSPPAASAVDPR